MSLPISKRYRPMEALSASELPSGPDWQYEPKWDGFRCLAFRDGKRVDLLSKAGKPLTRYFPELASALAELPAKQFVLDGEIVIPLDGTLSFDNLLMRIHPAASRIKKLSEETPCLFPATDDVTSARRWFRAGIGLDGVVAKRRDLPYQSGERTGMKKIKTQRTADCVVGGFRYLEKQPLVGSLLLGLYDDDGKLDHVGFTSSIRDEDRPALTKKLERIIKPRGFTGRAPGGPSRWSTKRSAEWQPLAPKLVVEVQFDHFTGGRFRHGTKFLRWRPDKSPRACTFKQVERENSATLRLLKLAR
ncbi:MAG: ATP-dependent DNA ligase [Terriglobales bacterium]